MRMTRMNDIFAFVLEVLSIVLLGRWAYSVTDVPWQKWALMVVAVLIFVLVWGLFCSPRAKYPVAEPWIYLLKFGMLFFPFLQFLEHRLWITVIAGFVIAVHLVLQHLLGRADWS